MVAYSGLEAGTTGLHGYHRGSYGGRYGKDGMDAVDTLFGEYPQQNPVEDIESHFRYASSDTNCGRTPVALVNGAEVWVRYGRSASWRAAVLPGGRWASFRPGASSAVEDGTPGDLVLIREPAAKSTAVKDPRPKDEGRRYRAHRIALWWRLR